MKLFPVALHSEWGKIPGFFVSESVKSHGQALGIDAGEQGIIQAFIHLVATDEGRARNAGAGDFIGCTFPEDVQQETGARGLVGLFQKEQGALTPVVIFLPEEVERSNKDANTAAAFRKEVEAAARLAVDNLPEEKGERAAWKKFLAAYVDKWQ